MRIDDVEVTTPTRRRARGVVTVLAVPVLAMSALFTWALYDLMSPDHLDTDGGLLMLPAMVGVGVLVNVIAVYRAPTARAAWHRGTPTFVFGGLTVVVLGRWILELLLY